MLACTTLTQQQTFVAARPARCTTTRRTSLTVHASTSRKEHSPTSRRDALGALAGLAAGMAITLPRPVWADEEEEKVFCDAACNSDLATKPREKLPSGVEYQDIVVGSGPSPPIGYQVVAHYVAMTENGKVFSNSLTRREGPYDFRVGAGQVIAGMDAGILTMKVGGIRRLYIPGELAFPKGLPSSPGRPRVPPATPVIFDVQLLYVPGLDDE